MSRRCKECGTSMKELQTRCRKCGWIDETLSAQRPHKEPWQCAHGDCTEVGAHSKEGVVTHTSEWYCLKHSRRNARLGGDTPLGSAASHTGYRQFLERAQDLFSAREPGSDDDIE